MAGLGQGGWRTASGEPARAERKVLKQFHFETALAAG
jgi:hypothetical protein